MIYLIAAICANLCMTFLMRYSEHHNGNCYALNIWNYLAGSLISLLLLQDKSLIWSGNAVTWGAGVVNGIGFLAALVLLQISIRRNGAPLTTTFNRLGILIPTILSIFLFDEIPQIIQMAGLLLCIFAIIFMNSGDRSERPDFNVGLILVFLLGGTLDTISKIFSRYNNADSQTCFVLYTFLAAFVISILLFFKKEPHEPAGCTDRYRRRNPESALYTVPVASRIKTSGIHRLSDLQCQSDPVSKYH